MYLFYILKNIKRYKLLGRIMKWLKKSAKIPVMMNNCRLVPWYQTRLTY